MLEQSPLLFIGILLCVVFSALAMLFAFFVWRIVRSNQSQSATTATGLLQLEQQNAQSAQRLERELREEIQRLGSTQRTDVIQQLGSFSKNVTTNQGDIASLQNQRIDSFAQQLRDTTQLLSATVESLRQSVLDDSRKARLEQLEAAQRNAQSLTEQLNLLTQSNAQAQEQLRQGVQEQLQNLQNQNEAKLEQMRQTVDEKLHATLEARLGESFKLVSERLEAVHRGLGEMQTLAHGVGDLKRVLSNVKERGTWGEVQLGALLEQILTPDQFAANIKPVPGSAAIVEFAIRLPGKNQNQLDQPVWLPIDAKFPKEEYERLVLASQAADAEGVAQATKALERAFVQAAAMINTKYISPPHTTDFALMFLPTEGLYAEVTRRPGLLDKLQRESRVVVAGPTTLAALLNSLQMGFRTLAMEQRSSEVWKVLGAVRTEFKLFGDVLGKMKNNLQNAVSNIERAETRTRAMERQLKSVQVIPSDQAVQLLGLNEESPSDPNH